MTARGTCQTLERISVPTLVVDVRRAESNLERMLARANGWGVRFRPHFKTHQSADIAGLFSGRGISACTVSSVRMAAYFAGCGWDDITLAVPLNLRQLAELRTLVEQEVSPPRQRGASRLRLGVLVDSVDAVVPLAAGELPGVAVWIKVDCGYARSGVRWDGGAELAKITTGVDAAGSVTLAGILTHEGRSYAAESADEVRRIHEESLARMAVARAAVAGVRPAEAVLEVSVGDTPGASLAETMTGVDEIRPGNFIFYDLMQLDIGSCTESDLAVAVACPVIGRYPERGEIVVYGGAVHLSAASQLDARQPGATTGQTYGCLVESGEQGLGRLRLDAPVVRISQEHGVIRAPADVMERATVGDVLLVTPVHSCLTCAVHDHYLALDGRRLDKM